jgi:hypothetical protein
VIVRTIMRPVAPALAVAALVLVGLARWWHPDTLLALAPLGALWAVLAAAAIWRLGLGADERTQLGRELWRRPRAAVVSADV